MIASPEHVADYWGEPDPNPGGHADNCVADFMGTSRDPLPNGSTYLSNIALGLESFANWDNPDTATNEAYHADSWIDYVGLYSGSFTWEAYKEEIDAGKPMLLSLLEYHGGSTWYGHSVVGYGYEDNMFDLKICDGVGYKDVTVGGFAVWDTWGTSSSQSSWLDWNWNIIDSYYDPDTGIEWWPFLDMTLTNSCSLNSSLWDWEVRGGVYFHPGDPIPEPTTIILMSCGLFGLLGGAIRQRRKQPSDSHFWHF
jgi:hypothetical protein